MRNDFPTESFDLVLSHGVLMYQSDPHGFLERHAELLREGGHLSLLTKNALNMPLQTAWEGRPDEALRCLTERQAPGPLGQETVWYTPEELHVLLRDAGMQVTTWFGLRIFSDRLDEDSALSDVDRESYLKLEIAAAMMEPFRSVAPGICFIACRSVDI